MQNRVDIHTFIKKQKILPLFYHDDADVCIGVTNALYKAGVRMIEFTNRGPMALQNFNTLVAVRNETMPDLLLAVGTIRTATQALSFINAGADFLISPMFDGEVCELTKQQNKLWIPGCMTPTEIHKAEIAGCTLVKLFPGSVLTPKFVSGIKDIFPAVNFIVTGGVDATKESIESWLRAGACAVGMGSKLIGSELTNAKNYTAIEDIVRNVLTIIKSGVRED
jgi:2-dehydro-3-deoxyphosphogluconate aldolase / (4S)-4-hydroxy-2-oxoglutarate aldolase